MSDAYDYADADAIPPVKPKTPHTLTREQEVARALQRLREDPFRLGTVEIMGMIYDEWTNLSRIILSQQAQELAYWKQQAAHFTKRCAEQGDSIAEDRRLLDQQAQEIERLKVALGRMEADRDDARTERNTAVIGNKILHDKLAAMTAERDEQGKLKADLYERFLEAQKQLITQDIQLEASQQRVRELEEEKANAEPDTRLFITVTDHERQLATLQATLAEREARVKELEAAHFTELKERLRYTGEYRDAKRKVEQLVTDLDTARQDAARLREAALWAMKKVKRLSTRAVDYKRADDFIQHEEALKGA